MRKSKQRKFESLPHIFTKLGVNEYLSKHGCTEFARQDSVAYIENPDLIESVNGRPVFCKMDTSFYDTRFHS
ncbi:hypothetical protein Pint_14556 [Pistacia integerrima]|uniref:Uncharacterized protein n=1 Tax=Pistacia integerrima TaxID=434235 RepID=A0ACC0Y3W9_9ROSI|nr:hypothetical protein Pint_14556 [Pistacia integerrima]